jgi:hypothetical protein
VSEVRSQRRRRSVAVAPALLDPAELPEDAPGRVKVISVAAPDDILDSPVAAPEPSLPAPPFPSMLAAGGGWFVVGAAGVAIVLIFVVGMLLTR